MPAILVASKMKSGLPKPVHSAAPILHVPPARTGPQPCYLKLGSKVEVSKTAYTSQIPLKSQGLQEPTGEGLPLLKSSSLENGFDTQIYTDWANHYLAKSGHKRLIKDLQQDVTDGVLLAQIIQVVANDKIEDINGCPKNRSQMIENIDACLNFLAAKGINTQGLSAEEIRNGNLKAILGLFFSLSRYKQQQQQQQQQPEKQPLSSSPLPPAGSQVAGAPSQCQAGTPQHQGLATPQAPCQLLQPVSHQQGKTQVEMQSSASSKDSSQSKIIRFTLGQKKISREKLTEVHEELQKKQELIEDLQPDISQNAQKISELEAALQKKDEDMKAMEERYKMYLEKARNVIKTLDPKLNPASAEIMLLRKQLAEKERRIEILESECKVAKLRDYEEKLIVSAWYNKSLAFQKLGMESRLVSGASACKDSVAAAPARSFLAQQRHITNTRRNLSVKVPAAASD